MVDGLVLLSTISLEHYFLYPAIKTGRYTHEKKTRDIQEVKRLQQQQKLLSEGKLPLMCYDPLSPSKLEKIIQQITQVHVQQTPHTPEFFEKLPEKEKEFLVSDFDSYLTLPVTNLCLGIFSLLRLSVPYFWWFQNSFWNSGLCCQLECDPLQLQPGQNDVWRFLLLYVLIESAMKWAVLAYASIL